MNSFIGSISNPETFIESNKNICNSRSPIKRICIIGAGWYGCHAARYLQSKGGHITILDKDGIFCGASSKNQNRLHLGYHYPRSNKTVVECTAGYSKFISSYDYSVKSFDNNFYVIRF